MTTLSKINDLEVLEAKIREEVGFPTNRLVMQTIVDISNEIPNNVNALVPSMAQHLAARFLHALNLCGDLMAIAHRYEMKMETKAKEEHSKACLVRAANAGYTKIGDKKVYADMDTEYLKAKSDAEDARSFRIMVVNKHKSLEKAHHHMRKISEQNNDGNDNDLSNDSNLSLENEDWSLE